MIQMKSKEASLLETATSRASLTVRLLLAQISIVVWKTRRNIFHSRNIPSAGTSSTALSYISKSDTDSVQCMTPAQEELRLLETFPSSPKLDAPETKSITAFSPRQIVLPRESMAAWKPTQDILLSV